MKFCGNNTKYGNENIGSYQEPGFISNKESKHVGSLVLNVIPNLEQI